MTFRRALTAALLFVASVGLVAAAVRGTHLVKTSHRSDASNARETVRLLRNPISVPSFSVRDLSGRTIASSDWRGKVVLVNFWATWCPPCRAEIPDLIALQDKYRDQLQVIGISEDEGAPELVQRFVTEHGINYPVVMSTPEIEQMFSGVSALPTSFILDRDSRIVQKHVGILSGETTERETRALAGLTKNVAIELADASTAIGLENAAQAREIPGIDLTGLSAEQRTETLQKLNTEACTCGCGLTVAKCRIDDPSCSVSLPIAKRIAGEIASRH